MATTLMDVHISLNYISHSFVLLLWWELCSTCPRIRTHGVKVITSRNVISVIMSAVDIIFTFFSGWGTWYHPQISNKVFCTSSIAYNVVEIRAEIYNVLDYFNHKQNTSILIKKAIIWPSLDKLNLDYEVLKTIN